TTRTACVGSAGSVTRHRRRRPREPPPPKVPHAAGAREAIAAVSAEPKDALVVFTPSGKRGRFPLGTPLLQAARSLGVDVDSVCGGRAICGRCEVLVMKGEFAKHGVVSRPENLSPPGAAEENPTGHRP